MNHREKVLVISVPQLHDLSARSLPDLNNPVVVRLANHIALKTWPSAESALGKLSLRYSFSCRSDKADW